jgi:hypothetical protein
MLMRNVELQDRVDYICVFNDRKNYQITHTDVPATASDLEVIEILLKNEASTVSLAQIKRKNPSMSKVVDVVHPRYIGPHWPGISYFSKRSNNK